MRNVSNKHTFGLRFLHSSSPHKSDHKTEQDETRRGVNDNHSNFVSSASESCLGHCGSQSKLSGMAAPGSGYWSGAAPTLADLSELKGSMTCHGPGRSLAQGRGAVDQNAASRHLYLYGKSA